MIITETVNGVTNYISLNAEGKLVRVSKNPMELPAFMTKEQAFEVIKSLRVGAQGTETKYRVKAVSQALRDMITDIIYNQLPEAPMVDEAVIAKAVESWKPKVKAEEAKEAEASPEPEAAETSAEEPQTETEAVPEEAESKPSKGGKKLNK